MTVAATASPKAPFAAGSIIWEKKGPLPVWAWALIVLGLILAVTMWRRNKAAGTATEAATGEDLPGNQAAPPIFIVPQAATPQVIIQRGDGTPGHGDGGLHPGRTRPPILVPPTQTPPATVPPAPPGAGRVDPPAPPPVPTPVPAPPGSYISVVKFTSSNPPWASTLSGMAAHFHIASWQTIWNHPLNAAIRAKRGAANKIQPGDKIFVPGV